MKKWGLFVFTVFQFGCVGGDWRDIAFQPSYQQAVYTGGLFQHRVIEQLSESDVLHVYIEGDGRPWWHKHQIALDPTPKHSLMLRLMALDTSAAIYLGRPCYFDTKDARCQPIWWTQKRYSQEIVNSLNRILDTYHPRYSTLRLFGHSGGGTLATLMTQQRNDVSVLVTLAANLDVDAWSSHHGYSELRGSLNPVDNGALAETVAQYHYIGSKDVQVPALIVENATKALGASFILLEGVDHNCCWQQLWPEVLQSFQ